MKLKDVTSRQPEKFRESLEARILFQNKSTFKNGKQKVKPCQVFSLVFLFVISRSRATDIDNVTMSIKLYVLLFLLMVGKLIIDHLLAKNNLLY